MDKLKVHSELITEVNRRVLLLKSMHLDAQEATSNDTKSSAGDKHETSRAMAQIEQEKIGGQLAEMNKLQEIIHRIDPSKSPQTIQLGSLIETNIGWFYLSVGIGVIKIDEQSVFCMTLAAPLGKILAGKKALDTFNWQEKKVSIITIC